MSRSNRAGYWGGVGIIEWLSEGGADMSILLFGEMDDVKEAVLDVLERFAKAFKGEGAA